MQRYQPRLLAFCRHMLGSQEDAEDVLQEVFAAAFNAILRRRPPDQRAAVAVPDRAQPLAEPPAPPAGRRRTRWTSTSSATAASATADTVHRREEFRQLVADVQELPETQRTALLLREIDALSYDQIAEAMETTVPSVKSLLVRARVSLAEAAEARLLTCEEVRLELGEVAEGIAGTTAPVRRHLRPATAAAPSARAAQDQQGARRASTRSGRSCCSRSCGSRSSAWAAPARRRRRSGAAAAAGARRGRRGRTRGAAAVTASGAVSAGVSTLASKAAAGVAAAVIVTAGAVEVKHVSARRGDTPPARGRRAAPPGRPARGRRPPAAPTAQPRCRPTPPQAEPKATRRPPSRRAERRPPGRAAATPAPAPAPRATADERAPPADRRRRSGTTALPPREPAGRAGRPTPDAPPTPSRHATPTPAGAHADAAARAAAARRRAGRRAPPPLRARRRRRAAVACGAGDRLRRLPEGRHARRPRGRASRTSPRPASPPGSSTIDFGPEIGDKRSSAQITNYTREELEGRLVVAVVNFPPRQIGPFMSEVLTLGAPDEDGNVILLRPTRDVPLGGADVY